MAIAIAGYSFQGPFTHTSELQNRSGVYAIICQRGGNNYVIDVGESARVRERVETHDRQNCWNHNCAGALGCAVYYTFDLQQAGRRQIEQAIRNQYSPPCGIQ